MVHRLKGYWCLYIYASEVHFDAFMELSVVQNHSCFGNFGHPFDAFG
jgi:hypothetical protein